MSRNRMRNTNLLDGRSTPYKVVMFIMAFLYVTFALFIGVPFISKENTSEFSEVLDNIETIIMALVPILFTYGTESFYDLFSFSNEDEENKKFETVLIRVMSVLASIILFSLWLARGFIRLYFLDGKATTSHLFMFGIAIFVSVLLLMLIVRWGVKLGKFLEKHPLMSWYLVLVAFIVLIIFYYEKTR